MEERAQLYSIQASDVASVCACTIVNGTAVPTASSPNLGPKSAAYMCSEWRVCAATSLHCDARLVIGVCLPVSLGRWW